MNEALKSRKSGEKFPKIRNPVRNGKIESSRDVGLRPGTTKLSGRASRLPGSANLTQQELAARLGKPQSFVSELERGQRRLDVVELLVISRALGADPLEVSAEITRLVGTS
jgi:hypothetical protein